MTSHSVFRQIVLPLAQSKAILGALQAKSGGVARGETAQEFEDHMALVAQNAQALCPIFPPWRALGWKVSFDNASWHTHAHLPAEVQVLHIPTRSPDIHKVIEHPFGPIKRAFKSWYSQRRHVKTASQAMRLLRDVVTEVVKPDSVRNDCNTIRATLQSIIRNGGDWADPGLR